MRPRQCPWQGLKQHPLGLSFCPRAGSEFGVKESFISEAGAFTEDRAGLGGEDRRKPGVPRPRSRGPWPGLSGPARALPPVPWGLQVSWPCACLGSFFLSSGSSSYRFSSSDRVPDPAQRSLCISSFVFLLTNSMGWVQAVSGHTEKKWRPGVGGGEHLALSRALQPVGG